MSGNFLKYEIYETSCVIDILQAFGEQNTEITQQVS